MPQKKQPILFSGFPKGSTESNAQTFTPLHVAPFFCDHSITRFVNSFEDLGWGGNNFTPPEV